MIISDKVVKLTKINNIVLKRLISSIKFRNAVYKYLADDFIAEQKEEISRKLLGLVKKWKEVMYSHNIDEFKSLCSAIENDPKFKLPWTVYELYDVVDFFVKLVSKILENQKIH